MAHVNTQVREAVRGALDAVDGLTGVFTSRSANLLDSHLPAAVIATSSDEVEEQTKDGTENRTIDLTVVLVSDGEDEALDDTLDALRADVEAVIPGALTGLAYAVEHTGGELELGTDEDGERWYAFLALGWRVAVWTATGNPEVAL